MPISLDKIKLPDMLRELSTKQLEQIAAEIRQKIIEVTSKTGGHVAPSLGAVELAVSLHAAFESPKDKIIWDVGHQAYAHKILSGGLAFEGVNNVDGLKSNLIVILNDNEMSISKNVGAISNYLTQVSTSNSYLELRNRIEKLVKRIPRVGTSLFEAARKLKDRTKHLVVSFKVDVIFEELGFKYFGPIDGHNIPLIISTLHHAKEIPGPVLIHVLTKKGKGYPPAEKDPTRFHGTGPFIRETGEPVQARSNQTYTSVFGKTMAKLGEKHPGLVGVTAAMIDGTGLEEFASRFPARFYDVVIADEHAVTFAGALAKGGLRPVVAIYSTFLQRAYDEIIHDVCLQNLPVVFALDRAGIVG